MQGHRRRRATQRSPATPISPKGGGATASISLSLLLHDVTDFGSLSLRELDAVALATNVAIPMNEALGSPRKHNAVSMDDCGTVVDNLCIIPAKSESLAGRWEKLTALKKFLEKNRSRQH